MDSKYRLYPRDSGYGEEILDEKWCFEVGYGLKQRNKEMSEDEHCGTLRK